MSTLILELTGLVSVCKTMLLISILLVLNILKEIKEFIDHSLSITQIFLEYKHMMCGYICIGFIDFMLTGKTLTENTNLFSPKNFNKNDDIILNYFMSNV